LIGIPAYVESPSAGIRAKPDGSTIVQQPDGPTEIRKYLRCASHAPFSSSMSRCAIWKQQRLGCPSLWSGLHCGDRWDCSTV